MKTQQQMRMNKRSYPLWMVFILFVMIHGTLSAQNYGTPTRYEAENGFNSNTTNSSANAGYSGSGYVTGLVTSNSETKFDKGVNTTTPTKIDIRYANGTGSAVTNLALYIGSNQKVQDLVFPSTGAWNTWGTLTVTFNHNPSWGSNIIIKSTASVATSVNIDYSDLSVDDGSLPAVAMPSLSPVGGTYTSAQSVVISTATSGATIYYTTNGSTPTTASSVYTAAIDVASTQTIKALGVKSGMSNSGIASALYTINVPVVATPTFSPAAGTYSSTQSVTLSTTTSGATIYFTIDGSNPTTSSSVYSAAISVASSQTIKALAVKSGMTNSTIATAAYTIGVAPVATPTFSPGGGTYASTQSVTLSTATSGATIYFTTNGSTPTSSSSVYSGAISVSATQTIKAIATKSGMTDSGVASALYTINTGGGGGTGTVKREYWEAISGTSVSALTSNANYPNSPTSVSYLTTFQSPTNVADNYGQKVSGYVTAPTTGSYTFWISSDDDSELWLSTDATTANKVKIASVTGWTSPSQWTKYSSQTSVAINLIAGTQYYIEALQKEGTGGDNLAVAWQVPGGSQVIIPGSALSSTPAGTTPAPGSFTQTAPASGATGISTTPAFSWAASSNAATYALVVSTNSSYTSPVINQTSLTGTSYTPGSALANSTVYYWKVTATNTTGSTVATNAGLSFTTAAVTPPTVATPTFSPAAGTYTSTQSVTISTTTSGATIYYTVDGTTPTTASAVYASAISVASTQTVKALAVKTDMTNSLIGEALYTITAPPPVPGSFSQTGPASGAIGASRTPTFTWSASSSAATYSLVVSTSSAYTSPIVNVSGLTGTSYVQGSSLASGVQYFWKVTATNSTGSTLASNAGISFTTSDATVATGTLLRELWTGITGQIISTLTSNANYPNNPTSTSEITSFDAPRNVGDDYGQRIKGYLVPRATGSYTFWIAGDNDVELWLSTNDQAANKVRIAYSSGYTNPEEWTKAANQASAPINLVSGNVYYVEALHKESNQGDHLSVAWQAPGGSRVIIPSLYLSTVIPPPPSLPAVFNQTAPVGGSTGVSKNPTFTWAASSATESYSLVVSTNSSFSNPTIDLTGLTGTSYTAATSLAYNTLYYWKVTAVNYVGTRVATNAGLSFTTAPQSQPGAFTQSAPASGATDISTFPTFTWGESLNADSYSLVVSTNSSYANPIVNLSGLTALNYELNTPLEVSTTYYWKVTSTNEVGVKVATNAGTSFSTAAISGTSYYVSPSGTDSPGNGLTPSTPWKTLAYAASQVTAGGNGSKTIRLAPGTYVETECTILPVGVNIQGSGESNTIITTNGVLPTPGVDQTAKFYYNWADGSLIQLKSQIYSGANPRYGTFAEMVPPANGNQVLSGFKLDGHARSVKAGLWVENRNNVTVHHVTFVNFQLSGAAFTRGDLVWFKRLPENIWMRNTTIYNCTFTNCSADNIDEHSTGCLALAAQDGANIYNITINEDTGYGIKFIHGGHFRNIKIHDCNISVSETDTRWKEDISMELWNFSYNNEIYNITCNTWLSLAAHFQEHFDGYQPTPEHPINLRLHDLRMIDNDGVSIKESVEVALSGVEIYNCYIQDKGYGLAIWGGKGWGGDYAIHDITVRNNIFTNIVRTPVKAFGNSSAVFIPANVQAYNVKIHNNVFDNMWHALQPEGSSGTDIRNNAFINTQGSDVLNGGSIVINNNLKYHSTPAKANWILEGGPSLGTGNILGNPGFKNTGNRWDTYYQPSSATSLVVDKGIDVGIPFNGTAPDIGRWEFGLTSFRSETIVAEETAIYSEEVITTYPNPSNGIVKISSNSDVKISGIHVLNAQGKTVLTKSVGQLNSTEVDLSQHPNDVYIFRIQHQRGVITKKVVLMK